MSAAPQVRKARILLVEDNPGDVELLRLSLNSAKVDCDLTVIVDGEQAVDYVQRQHAENPPDLAILDLNVPRVGGLEILEAIRASPDLAGLPVMILTSSSSPHEAARLEALQISKHVIKPLELDEFLHIGFIVKQLLDAPRL